MNPEQWERVRLLFEEALERSDGTRRAFVESSCGDDLALRDELLSLVAACERSPEIHEPPTAWFGVLLGSEPPRLLAGDQVANRYHIKALLGRGGMGEVYEAWDEELSIPVALKTLHLPGATEDAHKRLKLEGILARSVWHPNVCRLYDLGRHGEGEDAIWFLTMELLRGQTLSEHMAQKGKLPPSRARKLAEQMAAGLGAVHQAGIVHRDFKTSNIMLVTKDGGEHAIVMDFGIARAASDRTAKSDERFDPDRLAGTPAYMAPEQVRGEEVGPAADIYALGIVLYEMVTGAVPFTGDSAIEVAKRRLVEEPPSPRHREPDLDERWDAVIVRCLAREPHRRFARAEEVAQALRRRKHVEDVSSRKLFLGTPHTLPAERDAFMGRELESEELGRTLAGDARVVTLIGAGGMGKTRLAIHHAWRDLPTWPGGVWFCDLTEARSLDGIITAVASALALQLGRGNPVEQIGHAIAGRGRCLVILDNFEQVVEHASSTVGRWMARAGDAQFLVTSRERLGLGDHEAVLAVGPLSMETGVELLAARARRLRPALVFDGAETEAAREIVRLVDGMPLAIELAGARMRVMSAAQIVAQMRKRFSLLTGGSSARHETLAMVIDGSWDLLKPWEKSAWAQCALFEGGFTLDAAEAVIDLGAWPEAPWVVDVVRSVVDKSLLRTWVPASETSGVIPEARFGMFVSLQEYAQAKLREEASLAGPGSAVSLAVAVEERHGAWFARYGMPEALSLLETRGGQREWGRVLHDVENLTAACRRALRRGDAATVVATFRASSNVLDFRGPASAALELGREALRGLRLAPIEELHVLSTLASGEYYSGFAEDARRHLEAALALARALSDRRSEANILRNLGGGLVARGETEAAIAPLETALELARGVQDERLEGRVLNNLSAARQGLGQMAEARACAERALELARRTGNWRSEGAVLTNLGSILDDQGCIDEARDHYLAAIAIHRDVGLRRTEGVDRNNLGSLELEQGRFAEARVHLEAALVIGRELGARHAEAIAGANLGLLCQAEERLEEAIVHLNAALEIAREAGARGLEGTILCGLGSVYQDRGELSRARTHYDAALSIHRSTKNERLEGGTLTSLASLLYREGDTTAALEALAAGESLLRSVDTVAELTKLLCVRTEVEHGAGNTEAARSALGEAESLALRSHASPASELGRALIKARRSISTAGPNDVAPRDPHDV